MSSSSGTATFLCSDLAAAESGQPRSDDQLESAQRAHFRLLREIVSGDDRPRVKNLGDALIVVFGSAVEAVEVSLQLLAAAGRRNISGTDLLPVRIGLHVGEPVRDEEDYFGGAVLTARRICDAAAPRQLLVSELVQRLVGSRGGFSFVPSATLEAPGAAPLGTYEVRPMVEDTGPVAVPAALQQWLRRPLVGREDDLETALKAAARARAGLLQTLLVTGEPGIGKTRLAAEVAASVAAEGDLVIYGRCVSELSHPYRPFVEALEDFFEGPASPGVRRRIALGIEELARVVPALADQATGPPPPEPRDADEARYRLFDAFAACFRELGQRQALVLILDDLHWADRTSLQLLLFIARQLREAPVLLLATYRETELDAKHPALEAFAQLKRDSQVERITLGGLEAPAVMRLVELKADHALDGATREAAEVLRQKTEGNPLFIEEILRHLEETGGIDAAPGHWSLDRQSVDKLDVPEGVRDVIDRRTARLSEDCGRVLTTAAVMGREFGVQLLEPVVGLSEDDFLAAIEEAIDAGLIVEIPGSTLRYSFSHALVRDALYQGLSGSRRTLIHRSVAETAERIFAANLEPWVAELAHHYYEASAVAGVGEKAVDFSARAAERARDVHAYLEAAEHYEHAVEVMRRTAGADDARLCDTLLDLGDVQWRAGETSRAEVSYLAAADLARSLNQPLKLARAALGTSPGFPTLRFGVHDERRAAVLREALDALDPGPSAARARVLAEMGRALIWSEDPSDAANRRAHCLEAVEMARGLDDPETLSATLASQHVATWDPENAADRLEIADEIIAVAGAGGERQMEMNGRVFRLIDQLELGTVAREAAAELAEMARDSRQAIYIWYSSVWSAMLAMLEGRLEEAETMAWAALEQGEGAIEDNPEQAFAAQMFSLKSLQGKLPDLEAPLREMVEKRPNIPGWRAGLAVVECELGNLDAARREFDTIASADFSDFPRESTWQAGMVLSSELAYRLRDERRAAMLYELLEPFADRNIVVTYAIASYGSGSRYLGRLATVLGDYDAAERHFVSAIAMNGRLGARPFVALTQADYARLLLARGDGDDAGMAQQLLADAGAAAAEIGMAGLNADTEALATTQPSL